MKIIISEEMLKEIVRTELNEWKDYRLVNPGTTTNTPSSNYHFTNFSKWDLGNAFTTFSLDKENGGSVNGKMTISTSQAGVSPAMLQKICQFEKNKNFGYKMGEKDLAGINIGDANGHLTYGYGLLFHPNGQYMDSIKRRWSQDELESIYMQTVKKISDEVRSWARQKKINLNQFQIDAITCACYNFGMRFIKKWSIGRMIAKNPNDPAIFNTWANWSNSQGKEYPGLINRRHMEANWYFGRIS